MDTKTRKQLLRLILEILAILAALLLGLNSGCSLSWTPQRTQLKMLWPDHGVDVRFRTTTTTRPAPKRDP